MYKSFTAEEYRKHFNLPSDYKIDGFLVYGAWDEQKQRNNLESALNKLQISFSSKILEGFLSRVLELNINGKIYWFAVMYGGALLSEYVHLASLLGSTKNIHIGSCGGLYPEINSMDIIVALWSYGNESTTRIYDREAVDFKHFPDEKLSEKIISNLPVEYKIYRGSLMTNQAMMGETWDDVKKWSEEGYYGVEMESATVFSVSKHYGVPSTSLVYVSDNLIKGQTVGDESHVLEKSAREKVKENVYKAAILTLND